MTEARLREDYSVSMVVNTALSVPVSMVVIEVITLNFCLLYGSQRHKKARRAFTLRAFRTSADNSGIAAKEFWWSWRELNPRPKLLHRRHYMLSPVFTFAGQLRTDTPLTD